MPGTLYNIVLIAGGTTLCLLLVVLKGIGGGSGVTSQIFFVLRYVVALVMRILKWAHFLSESQRLPFGDSWREGATRAKSAFT